jgi:hypothetical protein
MQANPQDIIRAANATNNDRQSESDDIVSNKQPPIDIKHPHNREYDNDYVRDKTGCRGMKKNEN